MMQIYQSFHSKFLKNSHAEWLTPISVGGYAESGMLSDQDGENISNLNPYFCELTAIYWVWKNTSSHDVGFIHYRRYFDFISENFPKDCRLSLVDRCFNRKIYKTPADHWLRFNEASVQYLSSVEQGEAALHLLSKYEVVIPNLQPLKPSISKQYDSCVEVEPWETFLSELSNSPVNGVNPHDFFMNESSAPICNMFIMRRNVFDAYCRDLFKIINSVYNKIGSPYDKYNNRYPGFLAERYLWYWIYSRKINFIQKPLVFLV